VDGDRTRRLPRPEFTVAQAVTRMAEGTLWVRDRPGRRAGAAGHDGAGQGDRGTAVPVGAGRRRPVGGLLWANGRFDLPGQERQVDWRWHCAPLEEWDGLNPAGRR
jgi:hypothetical protein